MDAIWWPLAVVILVIVFFIMFRPAISGLLARTTHVGKDGLQASPTGQTQERNSVEQIMEQFHSPLVAEWEEAITKDLDVRKVPEAERARVLRRALAANIVMRDFDMLNSQIFRSQHTLLEILNVFTGPFDAAMVEPLYAAAFAEAPQIYENYPIDRWLGWLQANTLARQEHGGWFITVKGREFLKYLIANGRRVLNNL